jgi:hypothetical protein
MPGVAVATEAVRSPSEWEDAYPGLYRALAPEYRILPQAEVKRIVEGIFGEGVALEDVEGFFDDLGRTFGGVGRAIGQVASQAAPVLGRALPGALSGALGGAALGPAGIVGGALLGGLGSALGRGGAAAPVPSLPGGPPLAAPGAAGLAGLVPGIAAALPALAGGQGGPATAVTQLLAALGSPTVQQGLAAMMLGPAGARSVPTATGTQAPLAAITNLLSMLANRASAEWEAVAPSAGAEYIGEGVDGANPEVRAAWLYEQLELPEANEPAQEAAGGPDGAWLDDVYDELEAEFYSEVDGAEADPEGDWSEVG